MGMEQVRKNRKRTHYRNYINEKLVGNKRRSGYFGNKKTYSEQFKQKINFEILENVV